MNSVMTNYPRIRQTPMSYEVLAQRYPLLIRSMRWGAVLNHTEAVNCLQCLQLRCGAGEAVQHYGGPLAVLQGAIRARHYVKQPYATLNAERERVGVLA